MKNLYNKTLICLIKYNQNVIFNINFNWIDLNIEVSIAQSISVDYWKPLNKFK